jgi:crotonobetaine/carnitine-CoA ligase
MVVSTGTAHRPQPPVRDVIALVARACARDDPAPALIFEDGVEISRGDLRAAVESFGGWLAERIEPGDRIAIMSENRIEFMIAWLATLAAGGMLVSINPGSGDHDAGHILRDSDAAIAIAGPSVRVSVNRLMPGCPALREIVTIGDPEPQGLAHCVPAQPLDLGTLDVDDDAVTNVYYTSGTTGPPKGCMLGHDYWLRFVDLYMRLYGLTRDDRLLCCLQFFYGDPPWLFLTSLQAGTPLIAMRRFSVSRFWDVVRRHRVTRLFGLASIPTLLLKAPPSGDDRDHHVDLALQIGVPANLHVELTDRWGFPWVEGYGLTETGLVVAMPVRHARRMTGSGSIGLPCPEVAVRIVDDAGRDLRPGESGELLVRAPGMMRGYLGRPEETRKTLRGGWLHTGDLARADERGFLYFMGRTKDIIRRSGENVSASEVEAVLRAHPLVNEAAVLPVPDDLRGEEVIAHVEVVDGRSPGDVPPGELVGFCRERLAKHKVPRYIAYRSEPFPRTPSMRVKKSDVRAAGVDLSAVWDREREPAS